jgi:hypothetical protein
MFRQKNGRVSQIWLASPLNIGAVQKGPIPFAAEIRHFQRR